MSSFCERLSAQNWTSSRQLQQSSAPWGETQEMAELPYMTYSSVQCDESQTTKGQCWQLSLILPSVHLDAETGCVMHACDIQKCINVNHIHTFLKGLYYLSNTFLKIDQGCYILQLVVFVLINVNTIIIPFQKVMPANYSQFGFQCQCVFQVQCSIQKHL